MKTTITKHALCIAVSLLITSYAISQHNYQFLPPYLVDVQNETFNYSLVPGATSGQYTNSNAAYDANGNLYFHVQGITQDVILTSADGLTTIDLSASWDANVGICSDLEILPVPGECKQFFVLFALDTSLPESYLFNARIDCNGSIPILLSVDVLEPFGPGSYYTGNHISMAISREFLNNNEPKRHLFVQSFTGIHRWDITSSGISNNVVIIDQGSITPDWSSTLFEYESPELDLYDDGTNHILAWGKSRLNTAKLNSNYSFSNPAVNFMPYNAVPILKGIEVTSANRVFVCVDTGNPLNNGISYYTIGNSTPTSIANTEDYQNTELEYVKNLDLMCIDENGNLNYIDNPNGAAVINNSFPYPNAVNSNEYTIPPFNQYRLPDQIEYDLNEYDDFGHFVEPSANAGNDVNVCLGEPITLIGSGTNFVTSSWSDNNGELCANCTVLNINNPTVTTTYTFTTISSTNCVATDEVTVTVLANPVINLGPDQVLCIGQSPPNASVIPCNNNWTYDWSVSTNSYCLYGGCSANLCDNGTYCVQATDQNGCESNIECIEVSYIDCTPCEVQAEIGVEEFEKECGKYKFTSSIYPNQYTTVQSVLWDFGDGTTSSDPNPEYQFYYNGIYTVTLTVFAIDNDGQCCTSQSKKVVEFYCPCNLDKPKIQISDDGNCTFCFKDISAPMATTHPIAWQWDFGDGTYGFGNEVCHMFSESGSYEVFLTVTGFNGTECCTGGPVSFTIEVTCSIHACSIAPEFNWTNDNGTVLFENLTEAQYGTALVGFLWSFGDGITSNQENPTHGYANSGDYEVCLLVYGLNGENCCQKKICKTVSASIVKAQLQNQGDHDDTSPNMQENLKSIKLFPNPTSGEVSISWLLPHGEIATKIEIFNSSGIMVHQSNLSNLQNQYRWSPGASATSGLYLIRIQTDKGFMESKLIRE